MSVNSKMTAIANPIRTLKGTSGAMGLDAMASNLGEVVNECDTQADLITQIKTALADKAAGGGGSSDSGFTNIEIVTIASSFTRADEAKGILSAMVTNGETTYFVRKTKDIPNSACMFACFNLPVTAGNTNGYARWRSANGITGVSSWGNAYELAASAGDEYYKVVIS